MQEPKVGVMAKAVREKRERKRELTVCVQFTGIMYNYTLQNKGGMEVCTPKDQAASDQKAGGPLRLGITIAMSSLQRCH